MVYCPVSDCLPHCPSQILMLWVLILLGLTAVSACAQHECGPYAKSIISRCVGSVCETECVCHPGSGPLGLKAMCDGLDTTDADGMPIRVPGSSYNRSACGDYYTGDNCRVPLCPMGKNGRVCSGHPHTCVPGVGCWCSQDKRNGEGCSCSDLPTATLIEDISAVVTNSTIAPSAIGTINNAWAIITVYCIMSVAIIAIPSYFATAKTRKRK